MLYTHSTMYCAPIVITKTLRGKNILLHSRIELNYILNLVVTKQLMQLKLNINLFYTNEELADSIL